MRPPIPHTAVTGRAPIVAIQSRRVRRAMPPGLAKPVAVLAWRRVSPMPTAHVSAVAATTRALTSAANASGSSVSTPMNASSQPHTSTTAGNDRSTAITSSDAAS